jgi:L-lactate permease
MMISVTNINSTVMTKTIGSDMAILALVIPFLVLVVISGFKRTIEVWPAALVAGLSYAVACFAVCPITWEWNCRRSFPRSCRWYASLFS